MRLIHEQLRFLRRSLAHPLVGASGVDAFGGTARPVALRVSRFITSNRVEAHREVASRAPMGRAGRSRTSTSRTHPKPQ
jgi:hypothetical protein